MMDIFYNLCANVSELNKTLTILWQGLLSMTIVVVLVMIFVVLTKKISESAAQKKNRLTKNKDGKKDTGNIKIKTS